MKQSDRRAAARTPGQLLQRALKAGTGTTENVDVCESVDAQETAPTAPCSTSFLPSSKSLSGPQHSVASFPSLERRALVFPPTIVLVESAWADSVTIL